jgi:hypothetical protein
MQLEDAHASSVSQFREVHGWSFAWRFPVVLLQGKLLSSLQERK